MACTLFHRDALTAPARVDARLPPPMLEFVRSRLFARAPNPPVDVSCASTSDGIVISWTPGARASENNLEEEEHAVSVRFADGAGREATMGMWMDVFVGTGRSFTLKTPGGGDGCALEVRVRAENARGTSAWVLASGTTRAMVKDSEWGAQWKKSSGGEGTSVALPSGESSANRV